MGKAIDVLLIGGERDGERVRVPYGLPAIRVAVPEGEPEYRGRGSFVKRTVRVENYLVEWIAAEGGNIPIAVLDTLPRCEMFRRLVDGYRNNSMRIGSLDVEFKPQGKIRITRAAGDRLGEGAVFHAEKLAPFLEWFFDKEF